MRAIIVGLILCFCIAAGEPYGVAVIHGSPLAADFSTGGALFLFFILVFVINTILKTVNSKLGLSRGELITVYIMMIVACAIPSWGFSMNLLPLLAGVFYYATPENNWSELIHPHIPRWLVPTDKEAIRQFFEGLPEGEGIPWGAWLGPVIAWGSFMLVIYFISVCLMVILRKQWVEKERLLFPLTQLPLDMVKQEGAGSRIPPFFKNKLMWLGFAVPFVINSINALHSYFHFIPQINLRWGFSILSGSADFNCRTFFEVIGLSYLLSLDISLSIWFFAIVAILQKGIFNLIGFSIGPIQPYSDPAPPSVAHQALGALIVMVIGGLWVGRSHLKEVFSKAFKGSKEIDDSGEAMSYRTAVFGLIGGLVFAGIWLMQAGLRFDHMLIFLSGALIIFMGLSRIVAQAGLAYGRAAVPPVVMTVNTVGSSALGPAGLIALALSFSWAGDIRTLVMTSTANGLKLADAVKLKARRLIWAILLAILVSLAGSIWAVLILAYRHGGINLGGWGFHPVFPSFAWNPVVSYLKHPIGIAKSHLAFMGIGGCLMAILTFMRNRFLWWPLHPIGLALGLTWPVNNVWFSVFIAWLLKSIILKYGGVKAFRTLRPFFLGLILGGFCSAGVWLIIDFFTGMMGNFFTLT